MNKKEMEARLEELKLHIERILAKGIDKDNKGLLDSLRNSYKLNKSLLEKLYK